MQKIRPSLVSVEMAHKTFADFLNESDSEDVGNSLSETPPLLSMFLLDGDLKSGINSPADMVKNPYFCAQIIEKPHTTKNPKR